MILGWERGTYSKQLAKGFSQSARWDYWSNALPCGVVPTVVKVNDSDKNRWTHSICCSYNDQDSSATRSDQYDTGT